MKVKLQFEKEYLLRLSKAPIENLDDLIAWPDCLITFYSVNAQFSVEPDVCFMWLDHLIFQLVKLKGDYYEDIWGLPYFLRVTKDSLTIEENTEGKKKIIFQAQVKKEELIQELIQLIKDTQKIIEDINKNILQNKAWQDFYFTNHYRKNTQS